MLRRWTISLMLVTAGCTGGCSDDAKPCPGEAHGAPPLEILGTACGHEGYCCSYFEFTMKCVGGVWTEWCEVSCCYRPGRQDMARGADLAGTPDLSTND